MSYTIEQAIEVLEEFNEFTNKEKRLFSLDFEFLDYKFNRGNWEIKKKIKELENKIEELTKQVK
jgi:hypothetical protein